MAISGISIEEFQITDATREHILDENLFFEKIFDTANTMENY